MRLAGKGALRGGRWLRVAAVCLLAAMGLPMPGQAARRKVILDQDTSGPGGTNLAAVLVALQAENVDVLGITVESGDAWQAESVAHALRLLELVGRTEVPVYRGSTYPLVNTMEATKRWEGLYGKLAYKGAWMEEWPEYNTVDRPRYHAPEVIPPMPEGEPHTHAAEGTAAEFLCRAVRRYPGQVTIMSLGPMTNIALAVRLDDEFASLAKDFYFMGASLNPVAPKRDEYSLQFLFTPRLNFNFRWDPEAAKIALHAPWKRIVVIPTDATTETRFDGEMSGTLKASSTPAAKYLATYPSMNLPLWDELTVAVWLDPALVTRAERISLDVNTDAGSAGYGETMTWRPGKGPGLGEPIAEVVRTVDVPAFNRMFLKTLTQAAPVP